MTMIIYTNYASPLGTITIAAENGAIVALRLPGQTCAYIKDAVNGITPELQAAILWLDDYFAGRIPTTRIPLAPKGTAFQQSVWQLLRQIPYGQSTTYGALAQKLSKTMSAQAVGQAVGKNPISIMIPCHRVLGSGGALTGYAGGLDKKIALLDLEKIPYQRN
jgi:methylated-DNA-[protein]-cysteine S-methyltransferase